MHQSRHERRRSASLIMQDIFPDIWHLPDKDRETAGVPQWLMAQIPWAYLRKTVGAGRHLLSLSANRAHSHQLLVPCFHNWKPTAPPSTPWPRASGATARTQQTIAPFPSNPATPIRVAPPIQPQKMSPGFPPSGPQWANDMNPAAS